MSTSQHASAKRNRRWPDYRTLWRWHFYAGLFCIPFVLWLSATGSIYLFKPQIEAWIDRPYDNLALRGLPALPSEQVQAALAAVPGSVLNAYELPATPRSAARVLVGRDAELVRVYVHPETLEVLHNINEDDRFMRLIFRLHGELMQGDKGSILVELAASWTIVLLLSGLCLWWPRASGSKLAGVIYPRLRQGKRVFWRDLHAVIGVWVSFFALFLLITGLPWTTFWGGMLKELRQLAASAEIRQDWTTGRAAELADRRLQNSPPPRVTDSEHSSHHGNHAHPAHLPPADVSRDYRELDALVPLVQAERLPPPVLIAPPSAASAHWTARSETQNRPRRVTLTLDGQSASILSRQDFAQRPLLDRVIGVGVAAHEGQLFGPLNQALGLFTALGLTTLSISAVVLWWRRRPEGVLGAPPRSTRHDLAIGFFVLIAVLGVLLPLLGASMLIVAAADRWILRRIPAVSQFLGLASSPGSTA